MPNLFSMFINGMAERVKSDKGIRWADKEILLFDDVVLMAERGAQVQQGVAVPVQCAEVQSRPRKEARRKLLRVDSFVYLGGNAEEYVWSGYEEGISRYFSCLR